MQGMGRPLLFKCHVSQWRTEFVSLLFYSETADVKSALISLICRAQTGIYPINVATDFY